MLFTSMLRPLYAVYLYAKALYDVLVKTLYVFGYMLKGLMLFRSVCMYTKTALYRVPEC